MMLLLRGNHYLHALCTYPTYRFRSLLMWCFHPSKIRWSTSSKDQVQRSKIHPEPRSAAHWLQRCKSVIGSESPVYAQRDTVTLANEGGLQYIGV